MAKELIRPAVSLDGQGVPDSQHNLGSHRVLVPSGEADLLRLRGRTDKLLHYARIALRDGLRHWKTGQPSVQLTKARRAKLPIVSPRHRGLD